MPKTNKGRENKAEKVGGWKGWDAQSHGPARGSPLTTVNAPLLP